MREHKYKVWCKNGNEWEFHTCVLSQEGKLYHMTGGLPIPLKKETQDLKKTDKEITKVLESLESFAKSNQMEFSVK